MDKNQTMAALQNGSAPTAVNVNGETFYIRAMTCYERDTLEAIIAKMPAGDNGEKPIRGLVLSFCLSDESGERLFGADDVPALCDIPGTTAEPLWKMADEVNRILDYNREEVRADFLDAQAKRSGSA